MRVQVPPEELRRAGLGSRAQELLHPLAAIVAGALLEAVRPAVDLDSLINARFVQGVIANEFVCCRAVELNEEGGAERLTAIVGHEMAIADDPFPETRDVACLLRQPRAAPVLHPGLVPAIDRPLGRLGAVV